MILQLALGLAQAVPQIMGLFQKAQAGGTVTQADIDATLQQYGVDRAVFAASIAAADASAAKSG